MTSKKDLKLVPEENWKYFQLNFLFQLISNMRSGWDPLTDDTKRKQNQASVGRKQKW